MIKKYSPKIKEFLWLNLSIFIFWFIFWALLYDWNDRRFIVYAIPFLVSFVALAVDFFVNLFMNKSIKAKMTLLSVFIVFCVGATAYYQSFSVFEYIKVTNKYGFEFSTIAKERVDRKALTIEPAIPKFSKNDKGFSPFDIKYFANRQKGVKKVYEKKMHKLNEIKNDQYFLSTEACVFFDESKIKWNLYKNRYGNFMERKLSHFKDCKKPNLEIDNKGELRYYNESSL